MTAPTGVVEVKVTVCVAGLTVNDCCTRAAGL
jgi:hypothetical protein